MYCVVFFVVMGAGGCVVGCMWLGGEGGGGGGGGEEFSTKVLQLSAIVRLHRGQRFG